MKSTPSCLRAIRSHIAVALHAIAAAAMFTSCKGGIEKDKLGGGADSLFQSLRAEFAKESAPCAGFAYTPLSIDTPTANAHCREFYQNYLLDGAPFSGMLTVRVDHLENFLTQFPESTGKCRGIRVYHGIDSSGAPRFIFSPEVMVAYTPSGGSSSSVYFRLEHTTDYYFYDGGGFIDYSKSFKSDTAKYYKRVSKASGSKLKIDYNSSANSDPASVFFPSAEILALIKHNQGKVYKFNKIYNIMQDKPAIEYVSFCWAAVKDLTSGEYKHDVVMLPVLSNAVKYPSLGQEMEGTGANLNSRCPPHCDQVEYKK